MGVKKKRNNRQRCRKIRWTGQTEKYERRRRGRQIDRETDKGKKNI